MPELPEVETVANQLAPLLNGKKISDCRINDPKLKLPRRELIGQKIEEVIRLGKKVVIRLSSAKSQNRCLAVHLRMTGRLLYERASKRKAEDPYERLRITLSSGVLRLSDVRRFATVEYVHSIEELIPGAVDPLRDRMTLSLMNELIGTSPQSVKAWLLRQDKLVGLGNIYASEILYAACLHPERSISSLSQDERRALMKSIKHIIRRAVEACGTTFSDFQDSRGELGSYQRFLKVYGREGEPCRKCRKPLQRLVQQQRSTFFCPCCQV